jgi:hypothetical protein
MPTSRTTQRSVPARIGKALKEILSWSIVGWILTGIITAVYVSTWDKPLADALFLGALTTSIMLIGLGVMSVGGGGVSEFDMVTFAARRVQRPRDEPPSAVLTSLGACLFVVPQLIGGAIYLAERG